jgi:hypothetical protein
MATQMKAAGGVRHPAFEAEQEEGETHENNHTAGLVYWDLCRIANIKRGHMVGFEDITAEFAPEFISLEDLAEDLRDVLFPIRGKLFTGTYKDRSIMYEGMTHAFNKAISGLGKEPQVNA